MKPIETASLALAIALLAGTPVLALGLKRNFTTLDECKSSGGLTAEMCVNAFRNAEAEFSQKTQNFSTREACERSFGRNSCAISVARGGGRGGVSFVPRMRGVVVSASSLRDATVVPWVDGKGGGFEPRTILRPDTAMRAVVRRGPDVPPGALPEGTILAPGGQFESGPEPKGPVATFPVSPQRMKEIQQKEKSLGLQPTQ